MDGLWERKPVWPEWYLTITREGYRLVWEAECIARRIEEIEGLEGAEWVGIQPFTE